MTGKKPIPLKDEPVASLDELQNQLTEMLTALNALDKKMETRSGTQSAIPETVALATRNAFKELLEERQRKFEQEDEEARKQGRLTPQEYYMKMAEDYADVLDKFKIVCETFKFIEKVGKEQYIHTCKVENKLKAITTQLGIQPLHTEKFVFPKPPKQFKSLPVYIFRDVPLYCLRLVCRSRHVRQCIWICLFCIWLLTIATACFMAHDNAVMRKTIQSWEKQVMECER